MYFLAGDWSCTHCGEPFDAEPPKVKLNTDIFIICNKCSRIEVFTHAHVFGKVTLLEDIPEAMRQLIATTHPQRKRRISVTAKRRKA